MPLPRELQLADDRNSADDNDSKVIATTTTTADIHHQNHHHTSTHQNHPQIEEENMDRLRGNHSIGGSSQQLFGKQKWSFGRLFRKKKEAESASSSEEDRKAGFVPSQRQSTSSKPKSKHGKGSRASSRFDHIVASPQQEQAPPHPPHPVDNEFFLPVEAIPPEPYYQNQPGYYQRSSNSLDRRMLLQQPPVYQGNGLQQHKSRSVQRGPKVPGHSSEEELISLNSSTFSKYRSDESIHLGSTGPGQSRRSRAARNERYYKRLSRDGEPSHGGVPANVNPQPRYKTQPLPLSIYQPTNPASGYVQWQPHQQPQQQKSLQNTMQSDGKRSISYDSHIHLHNTGGRMQSKPLPPPPPPRDPLRRVHVSGSGQMGSSSGDLRPVSYAFDQSGRCVSDDRIWQPPHYQSVHSLNSQPTSSIASAPPAGQPQQPQHRRFITRSERNAHPGKQSLPNGIDFHYVADATPRSRKPIHMMDPGGKAGGAGTPPSSGILRTSKSGLPTPQPAPQPPLAKPRSISSSRLSELRTYPMPMYSEVQKPKRSAPPMDHDNIVCGSLHIKPSQECGSQNYVEIRHRDVQKTNSMPHHYQNRRSGEDLPNKYEEYVAEKREQHQQGPAQVYPERKQSNASVNAPPLFFPRKKPANLEEAINELEAIYKSLGLSEPPEPKPEPKVEAVPKIRVPTPSEFEKFALAHADDYDEEDSPTGEPDPVRDDVAFRNLQLANLQHRSSERQPPFGIPVGPIVPAPQSDYLHVEPVRSRKKSGSPDIVKDDLAVRALRKDTPGHKASIVYPMQKKQRATRTQSANIYNLIHRDAAKPSGGDLSSYMELSKSLERSGSMSNLQGEVADEPNDIPATLDLLRKLKAQDAELDLARKHHPIPFRHPSQGGAIAQLPERLTKEEASKVAPVPAPRKNVTPEPMLDDALTKIAQDAQASSIKLSQELSELRKEALITAARPKLNPEQQRLEEELQEIEAVSEAAKRCGQMLLETLPDADPEDREAEQPPQRKLHKEGKLIRAIDEVSEAANAVCEKILKDIVTTEPPVVVHEALQVKQTTKTGAGGEQLVMPHLIKKLDPIQSDKIEHIARRCMRQLSELAANPDYDNLAPCNMSTSIHANAGGDATLVCPVPEPRAANQTLEEIDKIMQECERQAKVSSAGSGSGSGSASHPSTDDQRTTAPSMTSGSGCGSFPPNVSTTASSFSSSSDCLAKSSSPSGASRPFSSSITSFNPYSSSDYIKSQSSDCHAPSTDPIKTFSTTSYEVQSTPQSTTISTNSMSTSQNPNQSSTISSTTNLSQESNRTGVVTTSGSPPPLQLTPVGERRGRSRHERGVSCSSATSSPSQYNSSEELAAIFGIEEQPKQPRHKLPTNPTGNGDDPSASDAPSSDATATATANANATSTNPAQLDPANCATNPVLNAPLDVTTSTSTSVTHPTANDNASTCSSHSYKLETIPEHDDLEDLGDHAESTPKLSPNFNRIYASKVRIVMDRDEEDGGASNAAMTQFDSLSSLEETSSNPDSGNVSLTDYPLVSHANASIELQTTYNSRFEVRERYVSEVSISASESTDEERTDTECFGSREALKEEDFPPLPTEAELEESLREELQPESSQETDIGSEASGGAGEQELGLDGTVSLSREVYNLTTEALQVTNRDEVDSRYGESTCEELTSHLDETHSDEAEISSLLEASFDELDDELCQESSQLDALPFVLEEDAADLGESDSSRPLQRRKSVVYETPQLNLSISEVKLKGEQDLAEEERPESEPLEEANQLEDTSARSEQGGAEDGMHQRKGLPAREDNSEDERPTTSSKALSVFGEERTVAPAAGGGAARGEWTTLEHVFVACTVGLVTPNDLLTLCLIIIGVIIIIAIALA